MTREEVEALARAYALRREHAEDTRGRAESKVDQMLAFLCLEETSRLKREEALCRSWLLQREALEAVEWGASDHVQDHLSACPDCGAVAGTAPAGTGKHHSGCLVARALGRGES